MLLSLCSLVLLASALVSLEAAILPSHNLLPAVPWPAIRWWSSLAFALSAVLVWAGSFMILVAPPFAIHELLSGGLAVGLFIGLLVLMGPGLAAALASGAHAFPFANPAAPARVQLAAAALLNGLPVLAVLHLLARIF
ncbi:MAG: hypothetical protein HY520_00200 [Candidatus Aenigmarchaeota archaeon]|nr:hypothetical protein [Candidatus Aenigmarchaeota archaeon]